MEAIVIEHVVNIYNAGMAMRSYTGALAEFPAVARAFEDAKLNAAYDLSPKDIRAIEDKVLSDYLKANNPEQYAVLVK